MLNKKEFEEAIRKAEENRVKEIISCSTSFISNEQNLLLSKNYPQIKASIGLYPLDILELNENEIEKAFDFLENHISEATAVGEVGLDNKYCKKEKDMEKQEDLFARFISLANKNNKPLIVHSRYAQRQALQMLEKEDAKRVLMHSYVDSGKLMKKAANSEYFVSVGMCVLDNEEVQKRIADFPMEFLLFETDSPIKFNGEDALPENIPQIAQKVANLKELKIEDVEKQQEKNYSSLFERI